MSISSFFRLIVNHFEYPWVIFLIIPVAIILAIIINYNFVKIKKGEPRRFSRAFVILSRIAIIFLLLMAIATPFITRQKIVQGEPFVRIIVDNSSSFDVFDRSKVEDLVEKLGKKIKLEVHQIGSGQESAIGDGLLQNLEENTNILLVSDGNSNEGTELGDIALYANKLNATINLLTLPSKKTDASVKIVGPSKTVNGVENEFKAIISKVGDVNSLRVTIALDGQIILDEVTSESEVSFTRSLKSGYHKIEAKINTNDLFEENNVFFKTVKVVDKPKILFVSKKESPMKTLLGQIYEVTEVDSLPGDLDYAAIAINDISAKELNNKIESLTSYLSEGGGMAVIGGKNSFDIGNYKDSVFETILPVFVATPGKQEGEQNIVLIIDASGSTSQTTYKDYRGIDVQKAIALDIIKDLKFDNKLAVVAFNTNAYLISSLAYVSEKTDLERVIKTLQNGGGTLIETAFIMANDILKNEPGNKNIILVSDGMSQRQVAALEAAKNAAANGAKIYTVGVGKNTNENLMKKFSYFGTGIYFRISEAEKIKILFGDQEEDKDRKDFGLTILNSNHFITQGIDLEATTKGFNTVVPKSSAMMLVTTNTADPILSVWRYGLGRVAALTTDDGSVWAGELLNKANSKLITRTLNYAIGDPDARKKTFVDIPDTNINQSTTLTLKTETTPESKDLVFYKIDKDLYEATIHPDTIGFQEMLGATFAVNYNKEYENIGLNPELPGIVESTGGKTFESNEDEEIIEAVRAKSRRMINKRENIRWPFILLALFIYLFEVSSRIISKNRRLQALKK